MRYTKKDVQQRLEYIQKYFYDDIDMHSENNKLCITNKSQSVNYAYGLTKNEAYFFLIGYMQGYDICYKYRK